jgi:hypothetical protein
VTENPGSLNIVGREIQKISVIPTKAGTRHFQTCNFVESLARGLAGVME